MKNKTVFMCNECGFESGKWLGRCTACGQWNTMVEERIVPDNVPLSGASYTKTKPVRIDEIELGNEERYKSGIGELDRVLGGGIVKGSLVLVGGDPGIGKSTLLLQMCHTAKLPGSILYVSGEESQNQIKMRGQRLGVTNSNLLIYPETNLDMIIDETVKSRPSVLIVDSVQTMYRPALSSAPGSVSQVREAAISLMRVAKEMGICVFLIGHVTKDGAIAGPRILEHIVDCVLYFEGERHNMHRILRGVKNRFGSTNEIGVFEMRGDGLAEVLNPSMMLLEGRPKNTAGSCVICAMEGSRPLLAEVQALVSASNFNMPRRQATGIDYNRITLLMAVLEKRVGMYLSGQDAYVNVIGGIKIEEPAADLGVVLALASGFRDCPVPPGLVAIGEVGLTGEIRAVNSIDKRIVEAKKLGFKTVAIPKGNAKNLDKDIVGSMKIIEAANVRQALELVLG